MKILTYFLTLFCICSLYPSESIFIDFEDIDQDSFLSFSKTLEMFYTSVQNPYNDSHLTFSSDRESEQFCVIDVGKKLQLSQKELILSFFVDSDNGDLFEKSNDFLKIQCQYSHNIDSWTTIDSIRSADLIFSRFFSFKCENVQKIRFTVDEIDHPINWFIDDILIEDAVELEVAQGEPLNIPQNSEGNIISSGNRDNEGSQSHRFYRRF